MTKNEYLKQLNSKLRSLPKAERMQTISFYREMIEDRIESGKTEEEAVSEMESVDEVAKRTLEESEVSGENRAKGKKPGALGIALIILGSPLWLAFAIAAFSIVFAVACTCFALIIALAAVCFAFTVGGVGAFGYGIVLLFSNPAYGLLTIGSGIFAFAAGVLLIIGCIKIVPLSISGCKKLINIIKNRRVQK